MKRLFGASGEAVPSIFTPGRASSTIFRTIAALLLLAIVTTASAGPRRARAAGPATSVSPASATVGKGADVTLDIDAADISPPGLGGYVITLSWNPAVASLTSLTDGGWVTGGSLIVLCSAPTIDNTLGSAELDCTPLPLFGEPGVTTTAPHAMAQAVFHGVDLGTTAITLDGHNTTLLDNAGNPLASTITNGSLAVVPSVGGVARPPDQAQLLARGGEGRRGDELRYGAAGAVALAAAGVAGWRLLTRRIRRREGESSS